MPNVDMQVTFFRQHLPWNDVRMVLHFREDNAITGMKFSTAKGIRDQINGFRRPFNKDDFFSGRRIDKFCGLLTDIFHLLGRFCAQGVNTAVNRGITMLIEFELARNNLARLLGAGRAIKVVQRLAVNFTAQQREIATNSFQRKTHYSPRFSRPAIRAMTTSRRVSFLMASVSSAAKAKMIICCAS